DPRTRRLLPVALRGAAGAGAHGRQDGARHLPSARGERAAHAHAAAAARRRGRHVPRGRGGARREGGERHHHAEAVPAARAGTGATGRSFDDRVGSTALILAVRALARERLPHAVAFVWSTREEIGLEGAKAAADRLGTALHTVYAIDTFVAADAPFEPQAFA